MEYKTKINGLNFLPSHNFKQEQILSVKYTKNKTNIQILEGRELSLKESYLGLFAIMFVMFGFNTHFQITLF